MSYSISFKLDSHELWTPWLSFQKSNQLESVLKALMSYLEEHYPHIDIYRVDPSSEYCVVKIDSYLPLESGVDLQRTHIYDIPNLIKVYPFLRQPSIKIET